MQNAKCILLFLNHKKIPRKKTKFPKVFIWLGLTGPTIAAKGCSPPQELGKYGPFSSNNNSLIPPIMYVCVYIKNN